MLTLQLNYIRYNMGELTNFMRLCLKRKEIPQSWGISHIIISKTTISFHVFGSKYHGRITIIESDSIITVKTIYIEKLFPTAYELFNWLDKSIE